MLAIGAMVVVAAAAVWVFVSRDDPPAPTATRHAVVGTVTQTGPRLCVEEGSDGGDEAVPAVWCGLTEGAFSDVSVGDAVVGSIIGVELDPGSGDMWSFWESLTSGER
jgi:hypothetical protein